MYQFLSGYPDLTISWDTCQGATPFPYEPGGLKFLILQGLPGYTWVHLFLLLPSSLLRSVMCEAGMGGNPGGVDASKENEQPTRASYRTNLVESPSSRSLFS